MHNCKSWPRSFRSSFLDLAFLDFRSVTRPLPPSALACQVAPIDVERGARHEGAFIRGQEEEGVGPLLRLPKPAEDMGGCPAFANVFSDFGRVGHARHGHPQHVGVNEPWTDAI